MFAVDGDPIEGEVHRTAEEVVVAEQALCMKITFDHPLQLVAESLLEGLQARNEVFIVSMFTNHQPDLRASSEERTKYLRQPNGRGGPIRFDRGERRAELSRISTSEIQAKNSHSLLLGLEEFGRKQRLKEIRGRYAPGLVHEDRERDMPLRVLP